MSRRDGRLRYWPTGNVHVRLRAAEHWQNGMGPFMFLEGAGEAEAVVVVVVRRVVVVPVG